MTESMRLCVRFAAEFLKERTMEVISTQLEVSPERVKLDSSFVDDLQADSLAAVEVTMALEEAFGIDIPDDVAERIKTVREIVDYIRDATNTPR